MALLWNYGKSDTQLTFLIFAHVMSRAHCFAVSPFQVSDLREIIIFSVSDYKGTHAWG